MPLFRASDRLPEDERILRISDPEDFALFKERRQHDFNGIIYDYGISDELHEAVTAFRKTQYGSSLYLKRHQASKRSADLPGFYLKRNGLEARYDPSNGWDDLKIFFNFHSVQTALSDALLDTAEFFFRATESPMVSSTIRDNAYHPDCFHSHDSTMVMALLGTGTIVQKPDKTTYSLGGGEALIIDDEIAHRAPPRNKENLNRLTVMAMK